MDTTASPDLDGLVTTPDTMTLDTCVKSCNKAGFAYSGMQSAKSCNCGNKYGRHGVSNCKYFFLRTLHLKNLNTDIRNKYISISNALRSAKYQCNVSLQPVTTHAMVFHVEQWMQMMFTTP